MRVSVSFRQFSNGWMALFATLVFLLFTALVLPGQAASAEKVAGGAGSPDASFFYSVEDLYGFAEAYGVSGREAYVRARYTFDVIWPVAFTFFLIVAISWLYGRVFDPASGWQRANLTPLLGMLFDYLENLSASVVMLRYPDRTPVLDVLAPFFTSLKWVFVAGSFGLLVWGVLAGIWKWVRKKTKNQE